MTEKQSTDRENGSYTGKINAACDLNWRRISYLKMAGNNESKVSKMKCSFFLSNSIYIRGRNFKQSLEVYFRDPGFD